MKIVHAVSESFPSGEVKSSRITCVELACCCCRCGCLSAACPGLRSEVVCHSAWKRQITPIKAPVGWACKPHRRPRFDCISAIRRVLRRDERCAAHSPPCKSQQSVANFPVEDQLVSPMTMDRVRAARGAIAGGKHHRCRAKVREEAEAAGV